jgi:prepilin peptidase CpaA
MAETWASALAFTLEWGFAAAMLAASGFDIAWRRLPNWLTAAVALGYLPWAWAIGTNWLEFAVALAVGAVVMAIGFGLFAGGIIGGGDAKMAAAVALWIGLKFELLQFFLVMSLAGGGLALIALAIQAGRGERLKRPLPYGVAIAIAALDYWFRHSRAACVLHSC